MLEEAIGGMTLLVAYAHSKTHTHTHKRGEEKEKKEKEERNFEAMHPVSLRVPRQEQMQHLPLEHSPGGSRGRR